MANSLSNVVTKFTKLDLKGALKEWGCIGTSDDALDEVLQQRTKADIANEVVKRFEGGRQDDDAISQLELIALQTYSKKKLWSVYKLHELKTRRKQRPQSASGYRKLLQSNLDHYFDVTVSLREKSNTYWMRIAILDANGRTSVTYVVHYPQTLYLFICGLKTTISNYLLQGFVTALRCSKIEPMPLSGRCIASLAQLAVRKNHKEPFAVFQERQPNNDPLAVSRSRKRKVSEEDINNGIILENRQEKVRRLEIADETFGIKTQPTLEKLEYKLETRFHSTPLTPGMAHHTDIFHCRVRFEGTNVLEGIRNLGESGLAELPMRPHLANVHSMGKNVIVLKSKTNPNQTT